MALAVEWLPEEWPEGIPSVKQLLDGSASVTFRIPTLKERLYGSFTTDSSGIDGIALGRIANRRSGSAPKSSQADVRLPDAI